MSENPKTPLTPKPKTFSDCVVRVEMDYEATLRAIRFKQALAATGYQERLSVISVASK